MSDLAQMGREVVAAIGWLPGMRTRSRDFFFTGLPVHLRVHCVTALGAHGIVEHDDRARPGVGSVSTVPDLGCDLTDPATQGCVMDRLRAEMGSPECVWMEPRTESPPGWVVQVWEVNTCLQREYYGASIPEALHAAVTALGVEEDDDG